MDERLALRRKDERLMLVLPAHAEVDVLTGPEHLKDLPPFGGLSRQPLDLDGVTDTRRCCTDDVAHHLASLWFETIRPRDGLESIGDHPPFAGANYEEHYRAAAALCGDELKRLAPEASASFEFARQLAHVVGSAKRRQGQH